jgi:CubicO group peptidase (beta-lactamase class C family)
MRFRALFLSAMLIPFTSPVAHLQERRVVGGGPQAPFAPPPIAAGQSEAELTDALDTYLKRLTAEDRFSGVVLLAKQGRIVFERAYGFADRANQLPNTTATRFNLGSVNKHFTKLAVSQLMEAGKLKPDDTIGALLPDYPNEQARKATVQQLLTHRGGISDFFGPDFAAASPARFRSNRDYYEFVAPRPLYFEPGTQERYCNGCYIVLGEIIARTSGMPYERYVDEKIFAPRGMKATGPVQTDDINPNVAMGYTRRLPDSDGALRANVLAHGAAGSAAGGGFSTAADLFAFFKDETPGLGIGGGAPGTNALVETGRDWTVIVLSNMDPPAASVGGAILRALTGKS